MKIQKIDVSVGIIAGLACLFMMVNVPVWPMFIGWAWYFALLPGGTPFKRGTPPMVCGGLLGVLAVILIDLFSGFMPFMPSVVFAVMITAFILMLSAKIPMFSFSLVSFNAYTTMFAGYYTNIFWETGNYWTNFISALLLITGANFFGLILGWLSVAAADIGKKA